MTVAMHPDEHLAIRLLRARCLADPAGRPWLVDGKSTRSAADVLAAAQRLATWLEESTVPAGAPVVIEATRSPRFVVALLAVWLHGSVPAPIDAAHPASYRERSRRSVGAEFALATDGEFSLDRHAYDRVPLPAGTRHVLFTSGTTGEPAAVAVGESPLAAMLGWYADTVAPTAEDRFGLLGGLGHDPVLRDVLGSLVSGGTLVVPDLDDFRIPGRIGDFLIDRAITIAHLTPALLEFGLGGSSQPIPTLREVLCGGAALTYTAAADLRVRCPDVTLRNVYGATETPQIAASYLLPDTSPSQDARQPVPVGAGVAGAKVALAAELGLDGDPDEIVVRSRELALGYVSGGRPGAFLDDALGSRCYRTGDVGRRDDAGRLVVVGRRDRQVSVNGYRLALEEIETAATRHPAVAHARAEVRSSAFGTTLAITVAPRPNMEVGRAALLAHLRAELPGYAVPSSVRVADGALDINHKALSGTAAARPRRVTAR
jgi:non-ribosomal peptide synthetase component F